VQCHDRSSGGFLLPFGDVFEHQLPERWTDVARLALQPETLKPAAQPISQPAVLFKIDLGPCRSNTFHFLALDCDRGTATCELPLSLRQDICTAKIADDLIQDVPKPA
jgi:hypothetical protein